MKNIIKSALCLALTALLCASLASCSKVIDVAAEIIADRIISQSGAGAGAGANTADTADTAETTAVETELETAVETEPETEPEAINCGNYTKFEVIDYFRRVALEAETEGYIGIVRKTLYPLSYGVRGEYTDEDLAQIDYLVKWLNSIDGFPGVYEAEDGADPDIDIVFGTLEYLEENEAMLENSYGSVTFWWNNDTYDIDEAYVRIVSDMVEQHDRNHIILEEIIQGMGLGNDTWDYEESLFYEGWNAPQTVPYIDELLFRALYSSGITPGMTEAEAIPVLCEFFGADAEQYLEHNPPTVPEANG